MDEYETLPQATPLLVSGTAGALAGAAEHCTMFPIDSIKTRMQSLSCAKQRSMNMRQVFMNMVKENGIRQPWRGMSAMAAGAGPAHAMYFTCLEAGKEQAERFSLPRNMIFLADGVSAVFATICHDAVMTPAEVVKQRMQMCCSPFSSCKNAAVAIYQTEGIRAFYRSFSTQLAMNIPFQASLVTTYMSLRRFLNPNNEYSPTIHFVAGALAGGVASVVTMPLDNCKTLLNTQEAGVLKKIKLSEISGFLGAARSIRRMVGFRGFFSGLTARVLYQAPSSAISWSVYEFVKYLLKATKGRDCDDCDTLSTLQEQKCKEKRESSYFGKKETEKPSGLPNDSLKDEHCVGSSAGHTISLPSDMSSLVSRSLHLISNPKFISRASANLNDGSEKRNMGDSQ